MDENADGADGEVRAEPSPKRVRAYLAGRLVADSRRASMVWEVPYYPAYYFPAADVIAELTPAGRAAPDAWTAPAGGAGSGGNTGSGGWGEAELYDVQVEGAVAERAARRYPDCAPLRDLVRLDWSAMSEWMEEDEPVYTHPRDPYHRVDILASSRHVRIEVDGVTIADSARPVILFETGLPPRHYLPLTDIRTDLLRPSDTLTHCPYKGTATYWSVDTGRAVHADLVWGYRAPLAESQKVAGLACFYDEKADFYLDDELQERPRTHFA